MKYNITVLKANDSRIRFFVAIKTAASKQNKSRRSSGVEQLIRNQQAAGSNPIAGSS